MVTKVTCMVWMLSEFGGGGVQKKHPNPMFEVEFLWLVPQVVPILMSSPGGLRSQVLYACVFIVSLQ